MQVGAIHAIQNYMDRLSDAEVMRNAMRLAGEYEPAGFDFVLVTEHHFHGYAMTPEPFDFLCWLASRTRRVRLGPGVTIVPWNDPYRVAAHLINLDHLSGGRALLGLGRGLSKIEMDLFGIDMSNTREMYAEGARKIIEAVSTGVYSGGGRFHDRPRGAPMRPAPLSTSWKDRTYCVGMSPPSALEAAALGGRLMCFTMTPWEIFAVTHLRPYLEHFERQHGESAPAMVTLDAVIVHEDAERARELAHTYIGNYFDYLIDFYGITGDHLKQVRGYEAHAEAGDITRANRDAARKNYVELQAYGTPKQILEKLAARRSALRHPFDLCCSFGLGGVPAEEAERGIGLFGREVLPVLKTWRAAA